MITIMGGHTVTRKNLPKRFATPESASSRWMGVSHNELAESIVASLGRHDIGVKKEAWTVYGTAMAGGVSVELPKLAGFSTIEGFQYAIGVIHSNDMKRAIRIMVGGQVSICLNGMVSGTMVLRRKHTNGLYLPGLLDRIIDENVLPEFKKVGNTVEVLQKRKLNRLEEDHALVEIARRGILPWSKLGRVAKKYQEPDHDEFLKYRGRAWGMYQAANTIIKEVSPGRQFRGLQRLTNMLVSLN